MEKRGGLTPLPYESDLCGLRFFRTKLRDCGKIPHNEWSDIIVRRLPLYPVR